MSLDCPPSSPVRFRLTSPSYDNIKGKQEKYEQLNAMVGNAKTMPTPDPSSSIGMELSSPVKNNIRNTVPTSPINEKIENLSTIDVGLERNSISHLTIGRKSSVCDIVLPKLQNISRQHAFITYLNKENVLKIECNGINGIVVILPGQGIQCNLCFESKKDNIFKVSLDETKGSLNKRLLSFVLDKGETVIMPFIEGTKIDFRQAEIALHIKDDIVNSGEDSVTESEEETSLMPIRTGIFQSTALDTPSKVIISRDQIKPLNAQKHTPITVSTDKVQSIQNPVVDDDKILISSATVTPLYQTPAHDPATPRKVINYVSASLRHNYETPIPGPGQSLEVNDNSSEKISQEMLDTVESVFNFTTTPEKQANTSSNKRPLEEDTAATNLEAVTTQPQVKKSKYKQKKNHRGKKETEPSHLSLDDLEDKGINCAEFQHILSNHLAFAAQQQTPLSQMKSINRKISQLSNEELLVLLENEKSIGVIKREGKDAAGKLLEEEFYYDLENDYDEDRKSLVTSLKGGRAGIRSSRKSHKQYFWKRPGKK
ncbi:hypothetical protein C6P45_005093 [Maudiozyma exigua]|uniref:FHA domain-containing protein n=1 Tax=Maudiozyma exigua TaxID=34358 RepID=A0A9P6WBT5_MAUEX|nr:hypothetical protein C6P45_005093 [Kazachstania exigua]